MGSKRPFGETRTEYLKRINAAMPAHVCKARREGDEMVCHICRVRWEVGENPPEHAKCR